MVYVLLAEGFEEIEALAFTDILKRAGVNTLTVSTTDSLKNTGAHNICVNTDINISDIDFKNIEAVVLPGGLPGAYNLRDNKAVIKLLDHCKINKLIIGAICASPYVVLEQLGYLEGINSTVNPAFYNDMKSCNLIIDRVVNDNNIITSQGPGTTHEFAKEFIKVLKPEFDADELIKEMLYK